MTISLQLHIKADWAKPILQSHPISDLLVSMNGYYMRGWQLLVVFWGSEMRVSLAEMVLSEEGALCGLIL